MSKVNVEVHINETDDNNIYLCLHISLNSKIYFFDFPRKIVFGVT